MLALEGWAQLSGWKLTWTGETGGALNRGASEKGTLGRGLTASAQADAVGERLETGSGLRWLGLEGGEAVAIAAAIGLRRLARLGSAGSRALRPDGGAPEVGRAWVRVEAIACEVLPAALGRVCVRRGAWGLAGGGGWLELEAADGRAFLCQGDWSCRMNGAKRATGRAGTSERGPQTQEQEQQFTED